MPSRPFRDSHENRATAAKEKAHRLSVLARVLTLLQWIGDDIHLEPYWLPTASDVALCLEFTDHTLSLDDWQALLLQADAEPARNRAERYAHQPRPLPARPTLALPGTSAKVEAMAARADRGEQLHHPDDPQLLDGEEWERWTVPLNTGCGSRAEQAERQAKGPPLRSEESVPGLGRVREVHVFPLHLPKRA